jgi:hypothetical protein
MAWDNIQTEAFFDGTRFQLSQGGDNSFRMAVDELHFMGWDRSRMIARVDGNGNFSILRDRDSSPVRGNTMNFAGWDGYNASAQLQPLQNNNKMMAGDKLLPGEKRSSGNGVFSLTLQTDGNLVLYNGQGQSLWSSLTNGKPVAYCALQEDGNFVAYLQNGTAAWSTATNGQQGVYLVVQNDGKAVMYRGDGNAVWVSKTKGK